MDRLAKRVVIKYQEEMLVRRVAFRYLASKEAPVAMEFPSDEAFKKYLHEHPGADPKNHTVKKHEEPEGEERGSKSETMINRLFDPKEVDKLPVAHSQLISDPDKLFDHAMEAHNQQVKLLAENGIRKALGAKVIRGDHGEKTDFEEDGPIILIGPPKKKERSKEKVNSDYGGDWSKLGDIVRSSIAVDSVDDLPKALEALKKSGLKLARKPKNRFQNPTPAGYRDIMMNVEYPNGHIGELQLHIKPMIRAKKEAHKIYEGVRSIEAKAKEQKRTTMNDEELHIVDEANRQMRSIYDKAWQKAQGHSAMKTATGAPTYYDFGGLPAYWKKLNFPKLVTPKGERVIYELVKFFMTATPISHEEFEHLERATRSSKS
jgi:hypothetical protein